MHPYCRHAGAIRCAAASCSRTESSCVTWFRLIAQQGRKQAFRLQLGSSACAFAPKVPRNRKSGNYVNPSSAPVRPLQADRNQSSRFMVGELHENCESMISMISCGMIFTAKGSSKGSTSSHRQNRLLKMSMCEIVYLMTYDFNEFIPYEKCCHV